VSVLFHPLAERELIAAAKFYETRAPGLGADFIRQAERTLTEIVAHPDVGSLFVGTKIRRRLFQRFPFGLVYQLDPENISIIAVMHLRRRPGYWKRRLRAGSSSRQ
jgi:plasmid stabilization system protein ParE